MENPVSGDVVLEDLDYGSDGDPDGDVVAKAFAELDQLALQAERATVRRKAAEDALQKAKELETDLLNKRIPELMRRMRQIKCTTASGLEVDVKQEIRASLPARERVEDRFGAIRWLVDNGHGGVVKNCVQIDLDRGEDERANALVAELREKGFDPQATKDVHAGTLSKLVRELMGAGKIVPKKLFNLFDDRVAKITRKT